MCIQRYWEFLIHVEFLLATNNRTFPPFWLKVGHRFHRGWSASDLLWYLQGRGPPPPLSDPHHPPRPQGGEHSEGHHPGREVRPLRLWLSYRQGLGPGQTGSGSHWGGNQEIHYSLIQVINRIGKVNAKLSQQRFWAMQWDLPRPSKTIPRCLITWIVGTFPFYSGLWQTWTSDKWP